MASNKKLSAVTIEVDPRQLAEIQAELRDIPNGVKRATVGAINKTLPQGRTVVVNRLFELLNVKRGNILRRTDTTKATLQNPTGVITILGRNIGLINFGAKDTRRRRSRTGGGVNYQIYRGGAKGNLPHAFIGIGAGAKGKGNRQVFERLPGVGHIIGEKAHHKPNIGKRRQSLTSRKGMSLLKVFKEKPNIETEAVVKIEAIFAEQLRSQVDRLLSRRKSDRPT